MFFYIFPLTVLVLSIYVAGRLIWPLPLAYPLKLTATCLLLVIAQQHVFYRFAFGGLSSPQLPAPVLLVLLWLFIAILLLFFLLLGHDIINGIICLLKRWGHATITLPGALWQRTSILALLALMISAFGLYEGLRVPDVRVREITLHRLPKELDGMKVVQLSDLHISLLLDGERLKNIVERTNALQADLILITGDIVDGSVAERGHAPDSLASLQAKYGVFSCLGNHEYYANLSQWLPVFQKLGLHMLQNSHQIVPVNGQAVVIAGITDPVANGTPLYGPEPDIHAALQGAPSDAFTILMAHQPKTALDNAAAGVDLQLSGHTHGGHVLGLDKLVQKMNEGFVRGFYQVDQMWLYINSGSGLWTGFPVRLGVPSEITCLILRSGQNE